MAGEELTLMTVEMIEASQIGTKAIAAAFAISTTGVAASVAMLYIGSAAVGATAENKEVFGLVLLLAVIPETIIIFGLVVALLIIF